MGLIKLIPKLTSFISRGWKLQLLEWPPRLEWRQTLKCPASSRRLPTWGFEKSKIKATVRGVRGWFSRRDRKTGTSERKTPAHSWEYPFCTTSATTTTTTTYQSNHFNLFIHSTTILLYSICTALIQICKQMTTHLSIDQKKMSPSVQLLCFVTFY